MLTPVKACVKQGVGRRESYPERDCPELTKRQPKNGNAPRKINGQRVRRFRETAEKTRNSKARDFSHRRRITDALIFQAARTEIGLLLR